MAAGEGEKGWIDRDLFLKIRESMPLASVDILAVHEGRLLLMRRANNPGKGVWFLPGGRIRYGETIEETVLRELDEETGLTARKLEAKGSMAHFWSDAHYVTTIHRVDVAGSEIRMDDEHDGYMWSPSSPMTPIPL